jgi:transcriptional regulator of NAD metabolism
MHEHILSDKEKELLTEFLKSGERKSGAFRMLNLRIRKHYETLKEEFELITKAKEKLSESN